MFRLFEEHSLELSHRRPTGASHCCNTGVLQGLSVIWLYGTTHLRGASRSCPYDEEEPPSTQCHNQSVHWNSYVGNSIGMITPNLVCPPFSRTLECFQVSPHLPLPLSPFLTYFSKFQNWVLFFLFPFPSPSEIFQLLMSSRILLFLCFFLSLPLFPTLEFFWSHSTCLPPLSHSHECLYVHKLDVSRESNRGERCGETQPWDIEKL